MNRLVILTNEYPYRTETGEVYLQYEIPVLSSSFDELLVIATDTDNFREIILPQNVKVIAAGKKSRRQVRLSSLKRAIKFFLNMHYKKLEPMLRNEYLSLSSLTKKLYFYYFEAKAEYKFEQMCHQIDLTTSNNDYTCIYAYRLYDLARVALLIKERCRIKGNTKCISRAHGYDLYENSNRLCYLPQREYLYRTLNGIFPCSLDGEKYIKKKYKCDFAQTLYLGSGDYGIEEYVETKKKAVRLVSCSTVTSVKQVLKICKAITELNCRGILVEWIHFGDGKQFKKVSNYVNCKLEKNAIKLPGQVSHDKVMKEYKANCYDLFLNVSKSEGLPQAIMEAISFGIPVVATDAGGNCEIVKNGISGTLIPAKNIPVVLADVIERYILMSTNEKIQLRSSARHYWEQNFNAVQNAKKMERTIKTLR